MGDKKIGDTSEIVVLETDMFGIIRNFFNNRAEKRRAKTFERLLELEKEGIIKIMGDAPVWDTSLPFDEQKDKSEELKKRREEASKPK